MEIKMYICECGDDFYEDDTECVNCGKPVEQDKFRMEETPEIISEVIDEEGEG